MSKTKKALLTSGAHLDKFAFIFLVLVGFATLLLSKELNANQIIISSAMVGLIIFYAVIMFFLGKFRLRADQVGDNCYYLGFLYTLMSLGYTLFVFSGSKGVLVNEIIANFGIALASTIAGISLRVVFHQMRVDPADVEREARLTLAQAATDLKSEMEDTVVNFNDFSRQMRQSIAESLQEVGESASGALLESMERHSESVSSATEFIAASLADYSKASSLLHEQTEEHTRAFIQLTKKLDAIDIPEDAVTRKIAPVLDDLQIAFEKILERLETSNEVLSRASEISSSVETTLGHVDTEAKAIAETSAVLKAIEHDAAGLSTRLKEISEETKAIDEARISTVKFTDAIETHSVGLASLSADIVGVGGNFVTEINKSLEALGRARSGGQQRQRSRRLLGQSKKKHGLIKVNNRRKNVETREQHPK